MAKKLLQWLPFLSVLIIWAALVITNYQPGTWFSGWDNLEPELNIGLNVQRALTPAWQEYQGLGLLGGMGHGAALVRELLLLPFALVLPQSVIRYGATFALLLVGGLGCAQLILYLLKTEKQSIRTAASIAGSTFYLLNIGTVQNFYTAFEPFVWFFGFLPWLLFLLLRCLTKPSRRNFILFTIVSILATPMGYLQTAFLVYFIVVFFILLTFFAQKIFEVSANHKLLIDSKRLQSSMNLTGSLFGLILLINAFWLLPVAYFTVTSVQVTVQAKANRLATPEVFLSNQGYSLPSDVLRLHGYWLSLQDFNIPKHQYQYLFDVWLKQLNTLSVNGLSWLFVMLMLFGLVFLFQKRNQWRFTFLLLFLLCFVMFTGETPPTGIVMIFLREHLPLFSQIFRSPFTKWIVPTSLIYSLLVGCGLGFLVDQIKKPLLRTSGAIILSVLLMAGIVYSAWPAFQGNFLYSAEKVKLPHSYLDLFSFFKTQSKQTRIAFLPVQSFFGWNFYSWGYRGSGFLWYGIEQPILDRAFDVWSSYDETFYDQFSTAVYGKDPVAFNQIVHQYNLTYLLVDESVTTYDHSQQFLYFDEIKQLLGQIGATEVWHEGSLHVYKVSGIPNSFVFTPQQYTLAGTNALYTREDPIYQSLGDYVAAPAKKSSVTFPFADLSTEQVSGVSYQDDQLEVTRHVSLPAGDQLTLPPYATNSAYTTQANVSYAEKTISIQFVAPPQVTLGDQSYTFPQLQPLALQTASSSAHLVVQIGNSQVHLVQNATVSATLSMTVGQPLTISSFDESAIYQQNGQSFIDTKNVQTDLEPATVWDQFSQNEPLVINHPASSITVTVPSIEQPLSLGDPSTAVSCDIFKRGWIQKKSSDSSIDYQAGNQGSLCDGASLASLNFAGSYLLRLQGDGKSGRGLKFYLENLTTHRADLEELLPTTKFDQSYAILSGPNVTNNGYYLHIEDRSFGHETSENILQSAAVYAVPLDTLTRVQLEPSVIPTVQNQASIQKVWKFGTYEYGATLKSQNDQGLLALSQGFDSGWIAFPKNNPTHLLPHVKYNGWANAWFVPKGQSDIIILYWPQLLSFAGYAALIGTIVILITYVLAGRARTKANV